MTTTVSKSAPTASKSAPDESGGSKDPLIVDLGKKSRKKVRQIRKGRGRGFEDMQEILARLKANGTIEEDAQPIFLVVREKKRRKKRGLLF